MQYGDNCCFWNVISRILISSSSLPATTTNTTTLSSSTIAINAHLVVCFCISLVVYDASHCNGFKWIGIELLLVYVSEGNYFCGSHVENFQRLLFYYFIQSKVIGKPSKIVSLILSIFSSDVCNYIQPETYLQRQSKRDI